MQRVFNCSGGSTSGYMTIKYSTKEDVIMFADTGREHPKTYKFLNDIETYLGREIIRVEPKETFREMILREKFMPSRNKRICTIEQKILPTKRHLKKLGIIRYENYIGFRYDEEKRWKDFKEPFKKVKTKFPLVEEKITKAYINHWWDQMPFKLEIPGILGNCKFCFLKGPVALGAIIRHDPEGIEEWIEDEELKGRTYIPGISYKQIKQYAQQQTFLDLEDTTPQFNCKCTDI